MLLLLESIKRHGLRSLTGKTSDSRGLGRAVLLFRVLFNSNIEKLSLQSLDIMIRNIHHKWLHCSLHLNTLHSAVLASELFYLELLHFSWQSNLNQSLYRVCQ